MSDHYLLVDDVRRLYFDCEKFLPLGPDDEPDAMHEQPFSAWLRIMNWGEDPPEKTGRYRLALPEGRALYDFIVASGWKVRIVSLDSDDFDTVENEYECAGTVWP
jgi:hypothetical protein